MINKYYSSTLASNTLRARRVHTYSYILIIHTACIILLIVVPYMYINNTSVLIRALIIHTVHTYEEAGTYKHVVLLATRVRYAYLVCIYIMHSY